MEIDLNKKKIVVCGFNQSGKTSFVKYMIRNLSGVLVYDWHDEYKDLQNKQIFTYVPRFKAEPDKRIIEFNGVLNKVFVRSKKLRLLVVDESNEYCPNLKPLPSAIQDLYDNHAHYNQSMILITRRPSDLNSKLIELAHYRIFFKLYGKNDLIYLDALRSGLGETVSNLEPYSFAVLDYNGNIIVNKPIAF